MVNMVAIITRNGSGAKMRSSGTASANSEPSSSLTAKGAAKYVTALTARPNRVARSRQRLYNFHPSDWDSLKRRLIMGKSARLSGMHESVTTAMIILCAPAYMPTSEAGA